MSDTSIEEALRTLTENEATVLYWKYWGLDYEEIGKKLGYSVDWVTLQMSFVYRKLNFDKKIHWSKRAEILKKDVYSVFLKLVENDPKNLKNFPLPQTFPTEEIKEEVVAEPLKKQEPDHEMMALVLYDEMREKEEKSDEIEKVAPTILIPTEVGQPRNNWRRILIVGSLLGCIGCLVVGVGAFRMGRGDFAPVTESSVPTVQALSTTEPSLITQSTDTKTPLPTDTVAPTETPFPTSTFTATISPTPKLLYEQDEPVYLKPDVYLAMNPDFGNSNFVLCYSPNPGFNLVLNYVNNSNDQFSLRFDRSQFHVFDDTGKEYEVETSGNGGCDAKPELKQATIDGGTSGRIYIGVAGSIGLDVKYLILKVDSISGYGPFSFKKDL